MEGNNYIGQIAFEQIERIRKEQSKDDKKEKFDIKKSQGVKSFLDVLINLEKQRLGIAQFNRTEKVKLVTYDIKPVQLECKHDVPKSKDFIATQVAQYKDTLINDDPERMPTAQEFEDAGYSDLVKIIDDHGGFKRVAEILNLKLQG